MHHYKIFLRLHRKLLRDKYNVIKGRVLPCLMYDFLI